MNSWELLELSGVMVMVYRVMTPLGSAGGCHDTIMDLVSDTAVILRGWEGTEQEE